MPKLIGSSKIVVDHEGLTINELAGNVATSEDTISIAHVSVSESTSEPWLTLEYDEWICVTKGEMHLLYHDHDDENKIEKSLVAKSGDTLFIAKGERFRPVFPQGDAEYIPVCLPAFRPDRCHREEDAESSAVTKKLLDLHNMEKVANDETDVLYHMCQKALWDKAVQERKAYFPPTFDTDGGFTHATAVPQRLIDTANHFYTSTKGDWICLRLSRSALESVGVKTKDEEALPVGETSVLNEWTEKKWVCPHIYGGLSTIPSLGIVTNVFDMVRDDDGSFLSIVGLVE